MRARDRRVHFTRRTADLWHRAEAATPKGDQGPISFDPVTVSQDPSVTRFTVAMEEAGPDTARVAVALVGHGGTKPYATARYHLRRERERWLIDDISGEIEKEPWSVRAMLEAALPAREPAARARTRS